MRRQGFTLIELMIAVAILGALSALAVGGIGYGINRARVTNNLFQLAALSTSAQMRARSTGTPQYLVLWEKNGTFGVFIQQLADPPRGPAAPDWTSDDVTSSALPGKRGDSLDLSSLGGVVPFPLASLPGTRIHVPLPIPYASIPVAAADTSTPLVSACSFCMAKNGIARGVVKYDVDGTAALMTPATAGQTGGAVAFLGQNHAGTQSESPTPKLFAIAVPTGSLRVFP